MATIQIYDPSLCCRSGVCGTDVDQALVDAAANIDWLTRQEGAQVERFNLSQEPMRFAENALVKGILERSGEGGLPVVLVDGELAMAGRYPTRDELASWAGISADGGKSAAAKENTGGCSGRTGCC